MGDNEMRRIFANRLRYYLNLNGYTQADMARYMNVTTATTAKWCTGVTMPRVDKIQSLCNWLGIEKSDLLDEKAEDEDPYYLDPGARQIAREIFEKPELRILFDAAREVAPEDLRVVQGMVDALRRKEQGDGN